MSSRQYLYSLVVRMNDDVIRAGIRHAPDEAVEKRWIGRSSLDHGKRRDRDGVIIRDRVRIAAPLSGVRHVRAREAQGAVESFPRPTLRRRVGLNCDERFRQRLDADRLSYCLEP